MKNYIYKKDDVLSRSFCKKVIKHFHDYENEHTLSGVGVDGKADQQILNSEFRSGRELNISTYYRNDPEWTEIHDHLVSRIQYITQEYTKVQLIRQNVFPMDFGFEEIRMKMYDNNGVDKFAPHVDVMNYASARRFLVIFFYLNDVMEGGETNFCDMDVKPIEARAGRALVFPPMWPWYHEGCIPISNPKYILGSYLHYN